MSDTILVAIITVTPTLIISFSNLFFQYKNSKKDSDKSNKREALKNFNSIATNYYSSERTRFKIDYEQTLNELFIYFPKINADFVENLEKVRNLNDWNKYYPVLRKTIKYLSSFI